MKLLACLVFVMLYNAGVSFADTTGGSTTFDQYQNPGHGWFWYETEPDDAEKKKAEKPAPPPTPAQAPVQAKPKKQPITVDWLHTMIPILQQRAIDNPTRDNLEAYLYAKRVMLDKAQRFTEAAEKVIATDPMLDENNRVPTASFAKKEFLNKEYESKQAALRYLAKNVGGLYVFFESNCNYCVVQINTIHKLQREYGFYVKYISVDGRGLPGMKPGDWVKDNGHAKMLSLQVYPTTVLAVPPNNYYIVSQGMMALSQLGDRLLTASDANHLLPAGMDKNLNVWDTGVLSTEDMSDGARSNPDDFVKYVKNKLRERY